MISELKIEKQTTSQNSTKYTLDLGELKIPYKYLKVRYIIEKILLVVFLPVWIPIFCLIYLILKFSYGGQVLYKQLRPGLNNSTFYIYKFKSMDSIDPLDETTHHQEERITKFGKYIRKHRIDELPQFFNVLKNEMSIIGPRPDAMNCHLEWKVDIPQYDYKYIIKPGITGLGQVYYKHVSEIEEVFEKFKFDVQYLNNINIKTDLIIIAKTFYVMLSGWGSR